MKHKWSNDIIIRNLLFEKGSYFHSFNIVFDKLLFGTSSARSINRSTNSFINIFRQQIDKISILHVNIVEHSADKQQDSALELVSLKKGGK